MNNDFFSHLSSERIANIISDTNGPICYVGPGIQQPSAKALALPFTLNYSADTSP
jgi:hypothetical protein